MIFRRLILCALLVGALAGVLLSAVQHLGVLPQIAAAEVFESAGVPDASADTADAAHHHEDAAWAPADGLERRLWTVAANIGAAFGFALLLIPAIALWDHAGTQPRAHWRSGLVWGATAWACVFALPAVGLPPEIPGAAAAALHERQQWWLLAAVCSAAGLGGLAFLRAPLRWAAPLLIALPFAIGAPQLAVGTFSGYPADIAAQLEAIAARFAIATALTNAVFWLALGALSGSVVARWLRPALHTEGGLPAVA